jgi:hypothetical protein
MPWRRGLEVGIVSNVHRGDCGLWVVRSNPANMVVTLKKEKKNTSQPNQVFIGLLLKFF